VLRVYAPFALLELSRSLGGKWNKKEKSWDVAATVGGVRRIMETFAGHDVSGDASFEALLHASRTAEEATYCRTAALEELEQPAIRGTEAWLHQVRGYHFARGLDASLLAMAMGTGKSKAAIDLCQNSGGKRFLILCRNL